MVSNIAPHHKAVTAWWSRLNGTHCSTRTNYRITHKAAIRYLAKRSSLAGLNLDLDNYVEYVLNSRLFFVLNKKLLVNQASYLEVLDTTRTTFRIIVLERIPKHQNEDKPPDFLTLEYLEQRFQEHQNAELLNEAYSQEDFELRRWNIDHNQLVRENLGLELGGEHGA